MATKINCKGNDKDVRESNFNKQKAHWATDNKKLFFYFALEQK